jgi:hypothetical protein
MKILLLLVSISIYTYATSQITLTKDDFATGGDTVRMSQATDPAIDFASTGAAYTWDFSNLTVNNQIIKDFRSMSGAPTFVQFLFGPFSPSKYQASYYIESTALPIAQLTSFLPVSIDNLFAFSRRSTDSLTSVGYSMVVSGNDVPFQSDTIETRYDFPLNFGNTHFSRGYTLVDFNPILDAKWNQHRTRTTEVDGYGSITTPYGTYNALRIKHDITESDSLYYTFPFIGATWIPIPIPASHEYEWWTNGEKEPILRITTNEILGNETVTAIEYRDIDRHLDAGINEIELAMDIYPNPVQNELHIATLKQMNSIDIVNASGEIVMHLDVNSAKEVIQLNELAAGAYQVVVKSESGLGIKSFVKR